MVTRQPESRQQATPARPAEPPRSSVSENRKNVVNPPRETPKVVSPPASQNKNNSEIATVRQRDVSSGQRNQPVKINEEKTTRIGKTIGQDNKSNIVVTRDNQSRQPDKQARSEGQPAKTTQDRIKGPAVDIPKVTERERPAQKVDQPKVDIQKGTVRSRNEEIAKVTLPRDKTDKIGTVIGDRQLNKDTSTTERRIELPQVRRPEQRKEEIQRETKGIREDSRRITDNRETSRETLTTKSVDSIRAERTREQRQPGHREERVINRDVREISTVRDGGIVEKRVEFGRDRTWRSIVYQDRPFSFRHTNRFECSFIDRHHRFHSFFVWPTYYYWVGYNWGPYWSFNYCYPYYHRRYIFVSLGGWWPSYTYMRYFWYGYHPYYWYGYDPIPYEYYGGSTYNYYTYNYYNTYDSTNGTSNYSTYDTQAFDENRATMQQQAQRQPNAQTKADEYFDEAVKAFEVGGYYLSAEKFEQAMKLAPDDQILPFAYAQALLAIENYSESAEVLRAAVAKVKPEQEGVFYPRGLYAEEDTLMSQIRILEDKAKLYPLDADLQLLLGYQWLGLGELDTAKTHLDLASQDIRNAPAANMLLNLLAKMKAKLEISTDVNTKLQSDSYQRSSFEWLPMNMISRDLELWQGLFQDNYLFAYYRYA